MPVFLPCFTLTLDGLPTWHSNSTTRPTFIDLAELTDPYQQQVHAHLIRRCPNITRVYHFGRPSFDLLSDQAWYNVDGRFFDPQTRMLWHPCTIAMGWMTGDARRIWIEELNDLAAHLLGVQRRGLDLNSDRFDGLLPRARRQGSTRTTIPRPPFDRGMWLNGHGYSVEMNPEIFAAIAENEQNMDARTARGYRDIYENAVRDNQTEYLGEWICSNPSCGRVHPFQTLNSDCHANLAPAGLKRKKCKGKLCMIKTGDGRLVQMTAYGMASNCANANPNRRCIGKLNGPCTCRCGLVTRRIKYDTVYDLSLRTKPPGRILLQAYRNGKPVPTETGKPLEVKPFCRIIHPWLEEGVRSGRLDLGWFQRNDMLVALARVARGPEQGRIVGDGDGRDLQILDEGAIGERMSRRVLNTRPRWSLVIDGLEYRTVPWSTRTREELEEANE